MKKGFTLIEVLISVFLMSLIVFFLSSSLQDLKNGYKKLLSFETTKQGLYEIKELLLKDILQSKKIKLFSTQNYDLLFLQTKNSLYNRDEAFVKYLVVKKENSLLRIESQDEKNFPISYDKIYETNYNIILKNIEKFKIYEQKNSSSDFLLLSIFAKNTSPIVLEMPIINDLKIERIKEEDLK